MATTESIIIPQNLKISKSDPKSYAEPFEVNIKVRK